MQDLRLIGVQDDGKHLLLADSQGARYRVPLDEQLRAAARRDRSFLGQLPIEIDGGMRPREIQALIRRGLSAEEVADRAGWSVEKVRRFEGPILAEREYIAELARGVTVGSGSRAQSLGTRIDERLTARGVDLDVVAWDSARVDDGLWTVTVHFPAGGRERSAAWRFDPKAGVCTPANDEAKWLSEDDSVGPIPTPHVATSANPSSAAFDIEAYEPRPRGHAPHRQTPEAVLVDSMREHSPRSRKARKRPQPAQLPVEDAPVDALPLEPLARPLESVPPPPVARDEHPVEAHLDEPEPDDHHTSESVAVYVEDDLAEEPTSAATTGDEQTTGDEEATGDEETTAVDEEATAVLESASPVTASPVSAASAPQPEPEREPEREPETNPEPGPEPVDDSESVSQTEAVRAPEKPAPPRKRSARPSVPRWDDIMFGKGEPRG